MKIGEVTASGNYILTKKITSLDDFWIVITRKKSIFARHRMYPSAFLYSWQIKTIKEWMDKGWFFDTIKKE
jgi:hypothetical protein